MLKKLERIGNTVILVKEVLKSSEFDNALNLVSYKLTRIKFKEHNALLELKHSYNKEKLRITKLATQDRKMAIKCFFGELNAIYEQKEQERTSIDCNKEIAPIIN